MCRRFDSAPATPLKRRRLQQILRQSGNVNSLWRVALRTAWWENYWDVTNSRRGNTGSSPSFGQFQLDLLRLSVVFVEVVLRVVILSEDTSCKKYAPSILRCAQIRNRSIVNKHFNRTCFLRIQAHSFADLVLCFAGGRILGSGQPNNIALAGTEHSVEMHVEHLLSDSDTENTDLHGRGKRRFECRNRC